MTIVSVYKSNHNGVYGVTLPEDMSKLPSDINGEPIQWQHWKNKDIDENLPLIGANPKAILDGIAQHGFYVAPVTAEITESIA